MPILVTASGSNPPKDLKSIPHVCFLGRSKSTKTSGNQRMGQSTFYGVVVMGFLYLERVVLQTLT